MPGRRISRSDASILPFIIVACLVGVEVGQGRHEGVRAEVRRVVPRLLRAMDGSVRTEHFAGGRATGAERVAVSVAVPLICCSVRAEVWRVVPRLLRATDQYA
jgi:hypothetical protein